MDDENPINIGLFGDHFSGKTSLIRNYCYGEYPRDVFDASPTIEVDVIDFNFPFLGGLGGYKNIKFYDIPGSFRFRKMAKYYLSGLNTIILSLFT